MMSTSNKTTAQFDEALHAAEVELLERGEPVVADHAAGADPDAVAAIQLLGAEPAFDLDGYPGDRDRPATGDGGPTRIALNLNRDIANGERWDDVLRELAEALDLVAARMPIEVHAVPMQSSFKDDDDLTVLRAFLADRPTRHLVVLDRFGQSREAWLEEIDRQIRECQEQCPPRDLDCFFECIETYTILGRPAGVATAPGSWIRPATLPFRPTTGASMF